MSQLAIVYRFITSPRLAKRISADGKAIAGAISALAFVVWDIYGAAMSRRLLKFSGGSVDDYATFSTSTPSPSC
jgi:L-alanine-DL-glutamate epimerase-like enolase superfamily enzyme